jgi:hypothetical protein
MKSAPFVCSNLRFLFDQEDNSDTYCGRGFPLFQFLWQPPEGLGNKPQGLEPFRLAMVADSHTVTELPHLYPQRPAAPSLPLNYCHCSRH